MGRQEGRQSEEGRKRSDRPEGEIPGDPSFLPVAEGTPVGSLPYRVECPDGKVVVTLSRTRRRWSTHWGWFRDWEVWRQKRYILTYSLLTHSYPV